MVQEDLKQWLHLRQWLSFLQREMKIPKHQSMNLLVCLYTKHPQNAQNRKEPKYDQAFFVLQLMQ